MTNDIKILITIQEGIGYKEHVVRLKVVQKRIDSQSCFLLEGRSFHLLAIIGDSLRTLSSKLKRKIVFIMEKMVIGCQLLKATFLKCSQDLFQNRGGHQLKLVQINQPKGIIFVNYLLILNLFRHLSQKT